MVSSMALKSPDGLRGVVMSLEPVLFCLVDEESHTCPGSQQSYCHQETNGSIRDHWQAIHERWEKAHKLVLLQARPVFDQVQDFNN